jgi:predicted Zn-dependent peptidase
VALLLGAAPTSARAGDLLPFQRFQLDNGLEVIVHEDHTVPVVAVDVWYHVGSKDERPGKTGFAHLFEHMMFQGSRHVGDEQHVRYIAEAGGWNNGTTNRDRTNYLETVPSNFLARALWLEADRMGFLLDAMTKEKLDNQRDVVRNERRQNYENRPYGLAAKAIAETIFPVGHPYHFLTIGDHADLEAATLKDVSDFFRRYYSPTNATLVIAGDTDLKSARPLVERYFATLKAGPKIARPSALPTPRLAAEKRLQLEDRVALERLYVVWPSAALFSDDDARLELLGTALSSKSGPIYRRLVYELRLAQSISVAQDSNLLGGTFQVVVTAKPGHTAQEILPIVDEEIARVVTAPLPSADLERARSSIEAETLYELMSVGGFSGRADRLNRYAYLAGDPGYLERDLARYRNATAESIHDAAARTLGKGRLVLTVVPKTKGAP